MSSWLKKVGYKLHHIWRVFAERHDQAWIDGSNHAEAEWLEHLDEKDLFIAEQAEFIAALDNWLWKNGHGPSLPDELERKLRDYR